MRILYITHLFPPKYFAGTETLTYEVAQQMRQRGAEVEVVACEDFKSGSPEVRHQEETFEGLRVHRFHLDTSFEANPVRAQYHYAPVEKQVREIYRSFHPDLVHVHHFAFLTTATATAAFGLGIPVVFTPTDFWMLCPTSQLLRHDGSLCNGPTNVAKCLKCYTSVFRRARTYNWMLKVVPERLTNWSARALAPPLAGVLRQARSVHMVAQRANWNLEILRRVARILAPTQFLLETFANNGVPREKIIHLPYGLNLARLSRGQRRQPSLPLRLGFIGTIFEHKGLHMLVQAFRQLGKDPPADLKIYGNIAYDPKYTAKVKALAADHPGIHFCGTFPPHGIGDVLAGLDVLVIPSLWYENTPLVLLSAQSAQLPVICSDVGGLTEVVQDGVNGLTFPVGDGRALAARLEHCLTHPELLTELAARSVRVKDIETYAEELVEVYLPLVSQSAQRKAVFSSVASQHRR